MVAGAAALYLEASPMASASAVSLVLKGAATTGVLTTNDPTSPNMLLYSRIGLAPTNAPATLSGRVTLNGRGLRKVAMSLTDLTTGTIRYSLTNFSGFYQFTEVETGRTYLLTASPSRRYQITPPNRTLSVTDDIVGLDFDAEYANY